MSTLAERDRDGSTLYVHAEQKGFDPKMRHPALDPLALLPCLDGHSGTKGSADQIFGTLQTRQARRAIPRLGFGMSPLCALVGVRRQCTVQSAEVYFVAECQRALLQLYEPEMSFSRSVVVRYMTREATASHCLAKPGSPFQVPLLYHPA